MSAVSRSRNIEKHLTLLGEEPVMEWEGKWRKE